MDIRDDLYRAVRKLGIDVPYVEIEVPRVKEHGDLSTPIAMILARTLKRPPREIAETIVKELRNEQIFSEIDIKGPGFINFRFKREYLIEQLKELISNPTSILRQDIGKGKKVQIEFVSANPTGPLHLGHGRGAAFGAALSNLLIRAGYEVEREYYINDAGRQVLLLGESIFARYKELLNVEYPFPEEGYQGQYIYDMAEKIINDKGTLYLEKEFEEVKEEFINYGVHCMLKEIEKDLQDFGVTFDRWQSEKALYDEGIVHNCLDDLKQKRLLYEKDGALWFKASRFGDEKDRVVIKQDGSYTYFASDIGYHWFKLKRGFDELINIWGADHHGYIPRVKAVIKALDEPEEKLNILLVQMVNLLRGGRPVQMSKRKGEFVTLREVIEEVGSDITKFIFLTRKADSHLDFDIEVAKRESAENPVFYVQYAYARISSIFRKAREKGIDKTVFPESVVYLKEDEEINIMKKLSFYPLMFEGAVRTREPHRITFYLQELASLFHSYYNQHRVLSDERNQAMARLTLCSAVKTVLDEGLSILGVSAPERM
jgi:arginyl-tRNA synthetase